MEDNFAQHGPRVYQQDPKSCGTTNFRLQTRPRAKPFESKSINTPRVTSRKPARAYMVWLFSLGNHRWGLLSLPQMMPGVLSRRGSPAMLAA
ncbi:hypothetical protein J7T55_013863 [Diaporthe amygdali]|uniref:uncharacterized protein n=1 Tax=Phomopsis amygdali TaxID=1214568 RepID=UPI0022FDBAB0|nr:uncharacterized protein J7T55_013863 [Diaporthe amygdali]KAJ0119660.1 hypothetical protein J7T55_013863 [Diaporthe amygdali]